MSYYSDLSIRDTPTAKKSSFGPSNKISYRVAQTAFPARWQDVDPLLFQRCTTVWYEIETTLDQRLVFAGSQIQGCEVWHWLLAFTISHRQINWAQWNTMTTMTCSYIFVLHRGHYVRTIGQIYYILYRLNPEFPNITSTTLIICMCQSNRPRKQAN